MTKVADAALGGAASPPATRSTGLTGLTLALRASPDPAA